MGSEQELETLFMAVLRSEEDQRDFDVLDDLEDVQTYEHAGMIGGGTGFVVRMVGGAEYQVSIKRSA